MPFPRFARLAREKRERLLEVAAQEFAQYGYEDASMNRILERAQMSKGAAYYYFEDKVDLYFTVVQYCNEGLNLMDWMFEPAVLSVETFWPSFADLHRQPLLCSFEQPWLFAAINAARHLPAAALQREPLASFAMQLMALVMAFIKRGQVLGVIRTDIADELLLSWLRALDEASDQWLLVHWKELDRPAIAQISDQTVDAMRLALAPTNIPTENS